MGHEDQFPPPTLSDRCEFGQGTCWKAGQRARRAESGPRP